ncbi:hypothetical protein B0T10DRAFT_480863 [Thelonectria olida]|uniref:Uncharacterized protein n=1 Tax=Thelonectria olida TaxID=1576542 RepID=A0A9P9ATS1_9HYPO|nr:hypothetical protein B0T10DRAFT_480863 [Thelonectria olida]
MGVNCPAPGVDNVPATQIVPAAWTQHIQHNASTWHPAFFTDKLRRAPAAVGLGASDGPVTQGYVYQDAQRRGTKL